MYERKGDEEIVWRGRYTEVHTKRLGISDGEKKSTPFERTFYTNMNGKNHKATHVLLCCPTKTFGKEHKNRKRRI